MKKKLTPRQKSIIWRKLAGLCLIAMSAGIIWVASKGTTTTDRDIGAILLLLPAGIYLLNTKQITIL